jgi:DNA adenine methylase
MRKSIAQQYLFPDLAFDMEVPIPVNVASVPQRSPFRYPGGKTWFVPTFRQWVRSLNAQPNLLIEPFAGGGIISLTALFENLVSKVIMCELDEDVASVWETVVSGDADWLAERILTFDITRENIIEELSKSATDTKQRAFQTILKNRTYHGGILAGGSGLLKNGENGKGIKSRWYPSTIAKRLRNLNLVRDRIHFIKSNALEILPNYISEPNAIFFIDPPYTAGGKKAGKRLYKHFELDHELLFEIASGIAGNFIMTYDDAEEVKELARRHHFQMRMIPMNNTHHAKMFELVISKNLTWLNDLPIICETSSAYLTKQKRPKSLQ